MSEWVIEASQLSRHFGELIAVNQLDLSIDKGHIYGFLGPNGCGKTTAIRLLTGLLTPSAGEVRVLGHRLPSQAEQVRYKMGYMTQKFSLYDDLTVNENLQFIARIYGLSPKQQSHRIEELLSIYDLQPQARQLTSSMSGGQRQRLALAAAVIHKPELLFLDEPTSAVDPENRRDFWEQLFDLCDGGTSIVVSTHYMDEAERCHQLAILESGIKRAEGSPQQLMDSMAANVLEIDAPDLRQLKKHLLTLPEVLSAAQMGSRLRLLLANDVNEPGQWLNQQLNDLPADSIIQVRPSLEDVFVSCTGQSGKDNSREGHHHDD